MIQRSKHNRKMVFTVFLQNYEVVFREKLDYVKKPGQNTRARRLRRREASAKPG